MFWSWTQTVADPDLFQKLHEKWKNLDREERASLILPESTTDKSFKTLTIVLNTHQFLSLLVMINQIGIFKRHSKQMKIKINFVLLHWQQYYYNNISKFCR